MELNAQVKQVIVERLRLRIKPEEIADDAALFGSGLGLDSIDALELSIAIEKTFGVEIRNEEDGRKAFRNVAALVEFIRERQARQS